MLKRSITGFLLGTVMIGSLCYSANSAFILLLVILIGSVYEWYKHFLPKHSNLIRFLFLGITFVIVWILVLLHFDKIEAHPQHFQNLIYINLLLLIILATGAVYAKSLVSSSVDWYCWIFYLLFPTLIAVNFLHDNFLSNRWILLGLIIMNWSNDVFAYFTGRFFGKTPLAAQISPKKTWEGTLGGVLATIFAGILVNRFLLTESLPLWQVLWLGLVVSMAGTTGDLYESRLKRLAGIKDSGAILPGHGGFLDRFDSFFYVVVVGIFVVSF
ncbi:MAG: phosphatidate cytidylyltransferase [Saprospiraceae bacterium]|nr:phosphatidate cytidylyltransferase [Saprospiraceae bacterium]